MDVSEIPQRYREVDTLAGFRSNPHSGDEPIGMNGPTIGIYHWIHLPKGGYGVRCCVDFGQPL